ncbi:MAG: NnrS family protein [Burkholderiaceae bacterium]|nr:NnrS family protein [Burkholderiaceae bacterium]
MRASGSLLDRAAARPLFSCTLRPMFVATAGFAAIGLALWSAFLAFGLAVPAVPGGPVAWHAHEMVFGFGLAAVAGFVATAVPEFTGTPAFGPRVALGITAGWLAARTAFWASGLIGPWPAAVLGSGFAASLPVLVCRRLMADPEHRHTGFLWGLLAIATTAAGYHLDVLRGVDPLRWAHAGIGAMMALIVVAMSRVSMRIVNDALDARRAAADPDAPEYRARPPRRNLAIFAIALHTTVEFVVPDSPVAAWTALAAAAAVLNLLNDWHVGRALCTRLPSMLYAVYWLMALGYAAIGAALMTGAFGTSVGRHLLAAGAMGLSIYAVLSIAGRIHGGRPLDQRAWVPTGAALVIIAALARAGAGIPGLPSTALLHLAGVAWIGAFGLYLAKMLPVFVTARSDGGSGCEEWIAPVPAAPGSGPAAIDPAGSTRAG